MTREPLTLVDTRSDPIGVKILEAIRGCDLTSEQCTKLKQVIIYLTKEPPGGLKIPAMSREEVTLSMIALNQSRKKLAKKIS